MAADWNDLLIDSILGCSEARGSDAATPMEDESSYKGKGRGVKCNEWGALLLYDQVTRAMQLFDNEVVAACDNSVRSKFAPLTWSLQVLTLDKPADIRGLTMPTECQGKITAATIRCLLSCRVDFSRDAVVRINLDSVLSSSSITSKPNS